MKKPHTFLVLLALFAILLLEGCITNYPQSNKLNVVATIFPYYDFAKEVGGNKV